MEVLQIFVVTLFLICCAVLVFLVMIQSGKGGSMGIFGGGGSSTAFGSSTVDVVTKATWYATVVFFGLALVAAGVFASGGEKLPDGKKPKTKTTRQIPGAGQTGAGAKKSTDKTAPGQTDPTKKAPTNGDKK